MAVSSDRALVSGWRFRGEIRVPSPPSGAPRPIRPPRGGGAGAPAVYPVPPAARTGRTGPPPPP
eukprot:CAMPEP_0194348136 /NCGR_PEP_ID=MMETSP0171-20130528/106371_1 /TAXON_ID=218684 /ORGANISM="Corethron pennatum, Strain L29A3" /LENGTH=63 /DNA_ID=CAMNT_0039115449 /DNA_START=604 /DNA_END=791 /DNA_ORIENTATION=-